MTDNEIMKALECCACGNSCEDKCPFYDARSEEDLLNAMADCTARLNDCARNLINRQKAEIERLEEKVREKSTEIKSLISGMDRSTKEKREAIEIINRQKAEIKALIAGQETLQKYIATTKSEAIKEFAEKLKATYPDRKDARFTLDDCYTFEVIDNLVKEMTEEKRL